MYYQKIPTALGGILIEAVISRGPACLRRKPINLKIVKINYLIFSSGSGQVHQI